MPDIATALLREHPANVRERLDDIAEMAASIRAHGILQPLIVQPNPDRSQPGTFLILAGHRRLAGAHAAGLTRVPCIVREAAGPKAIEIMLIENCQRSDLGPIEKAEAMGKLRRRRMSASDIARAIGLSPSTVSYFLSLLDLDKASQERVRQGLVPVGAAVKAVRQTRRVNGERRGGSRAATAEAEHFSHRHPLADQARIRCQLAGHTAPKYGRDSGGKSKVACGECWEYVIRADERGERLPSDEPPSTAREDRLRAVAEMPMLTGPVANGASVTSSEAARRLGVTPRTIERYKADIAGAVA